MKQLIAYCGLDCEKCDAYIATQNNDQALREKTAKYWSELNGVEITPEMINCDGCRMDGRKTPYCASLCQIKKCAQSKQMETCGSCEQMKNCPTVGMIVKNNPDALKNLEKDNSESKPVEVNPEDTTRVMAYKLWMKAPNPMVTFFKTLDVTNLVKISRKKHLKFNMLLDWCIGKAASSIKEFYTLPVGDRLLQYKNLAVNTIVKNKDGEVNSCDLLFSENINDFNCDYLKHTANSAEKCTDRDLSDSCMVIGTSAIIDTEIDGAVGMNSGIFNNPFIIWGKYKKLWFRYKLSLSFQFHHTQMDGAHAGKFLANLQNEIVEVKL